MIKLTREKVFDHKKNTKVKQPSVFLEKVREHFIQNLQISTDVVCFLAFIEILLGKKCQISTEF